MLLPRLEEDILIETGLRLDGSGLTLGLRTTAGLEGLPELEIGVQEISQTYSFDFFI